MECNDVARTRQLRDNFAEGDILVTPMTQLNVLDIVAQAGGMVTNEGGMLSHAAIIAREMGVPCIVGTHLATTTIHDGDLITLDTENGEVHIHERSNQ